MAACYDKAGGQLQLDQWEAGIDNEAGSETCMGWLRMRQTVDFKWPRTKMTRTTGMAKMSTTKRKNDSKDDEDKKYNDYTTINLARWTRMKRTMRTQRTRRMARTTWSDSTSGMGRFMLADIPATAGGGLLPAPHRSPTPVKR